MSIRLTDEQRVVYIMRNVLDFSYREIAEVLGISEKIVKSRLHRAQAKLNKFFASRCQWMDLHNSCTCKSRIGFALAFDPEMLRIQDPDLEELPGGAAHYAARASESAHATF